MAGRLAITGVLLAQAPAGAAEAETAAEEKTFHVVRPGETLWTISSHLTGDPRYWEEIYRANRDQIKDPSTLYPGQRLAIPEFGEEPPPVELEAPGPQVSSPPRE